MSKSKLQESQQQGQGITIGTQGNEDQPTPLGDDLHYSQRGEESRKIPNQEKSSATNQEKANRESDR